MGLIEESRQFLSNMLAKQVVTNNYLSRLEDVENKTGLVSNRDLWVNELDIISASLGEMRAGAFYALSTGAYPQDADANGAFMVADPITFPEGTFNIGGVKNGTLQFGLSSVDGTAVAGAGAVKLDVDGLTIYTTPDYTSPEEKITFKRAADNVTQTRIQVNKYPSGATYGGYEQYIDTTEMYNYLLIGLLPPVWYGYPKSGRIRFDSNNSVSGANVSSISQWYITGSGNYGSGVTWAQTGITQYIDELANIDYIKASTTNGDIILNPGFNDVTYRTGYVRALRGLQIRNTESEMSKGLLTWNVNRDTLDLQQTGTVLQLGQEIHFYIKNQTGSTITNGQAVQFAGSLGASGIILGTPAIADGSVPAIYVMGIATQDILNGGEGKVTFFGEVNGIDTSGYAAGDILYLNPAVPGGLTKTEPAAPNLRYAIAAALNSKSNGTIFVRAIYPMDLSEINDVKLTSPASGDVLTYTGTVWENKPASGGSTSPNPSYLLETSTECWSKTDGSFINTAIGTGTISNVSGSANHPGQIKISSVATSNTGGTFSLPATDNIVLGGVEEWQVIVSPQQSNSNCTGMIGFTSDYSSATVTPNNFLGVKFTGNGTNIDLAFLSRVAGSGTATNFTTLTAGSWYKIKLTNGGAGAVNVYVYDMSGTQLATYNFTGSIPTAAMGFGVKAYRTNATASDLIFIDRIDLYSTGKYTR